LQSHYMAFAAEASRLENGKRMQVADFGKQE
jgi:hypothetical protein